ncbi:DUF5134 domain-containing protein [Streptomyces sp. NPDC006923]|uniref:DUF5134 domain-containing protein n=1 Tax=Streptomyces sp. NPDC006923 TaxID=3155355 RepID=UPI0033E20709
MSASTAVYCMLTALFAASAVHGLRGAVMPRGTGWRRRGDHLLHTAMALAMAVMPWHWGAWLHHPVQVAFFGSAALWFPLTALCRHQESRRAALVRGLPSTVGMAAMAWMLWAAHPASGPSHENFAAPPADSRHTVNPGHATHPASVTQTVSAVLALYLLACALWSLLRVMPTSRPHANSETPYDGHESYRRFWDGSMMLGTVIMLLFPHQGVL